MDKVPSDEIFLLLFLKLSGKVFSPLKERPGKVEPPPIPSPTVGALSQGGEVITHTITTETKYVNVIPGLTRNPAIF
jgi:hypothetical protein